KRPRQPGGANRPRHRLHGGEWTGRRPHHGRGHRQRDDPRRAESRLRRLLHDEARRYGPRPVDRATPRARRQWGVARGDRARCGQCVHRRAAGRDSVSAILVVDDVPAMAEQYAYDLKRVGGYDVLVALSGRAALDLLEREAVDCVILDLEMPGMDGFEVLRTMERRGLRMPVLVYTGTGNYDRCTEAIRLGARSFIDKAEPMERVVQEVEHALEQQRLAGQLAATPGRPDAAAPLLGPGTGAHVYRDGQLRPLHGGHPARRPELHRQGRADGTRGAGGRARARAAAPRGAARRPAGPPRFRGPARGREPRHAGAQGRDRA